MKQWIGTYCIFMLVTVNLADAQALSGRKQAFMQALLDSADTYKLKAPARTVEFVNTILRNSPETGNELLHIRACISMANAFKMMSDASQALRYASHAIELSERISNKEYQLRSYYMKSTIFDQYEQQDSAIVYYQKVINSHVPGMDPHYVANAYSNIGNIYQLIGNLPKAEEYLLKGYQLSSKDESAKTFTLAAVIMFYAGQDNPKYLPYLDTLLLSEFYKNSSASSFPSHFEAFLLLGNATDAEREKKMRQVYDYAVVNSPLTNQIEFGMRLHESLERQGRNEEAHRLLLELLEKAKRSQNGIRLGEVVYALYQNARKQNDMMDALKYLEWHSQLRDSLLSEENANRISELNVRFETAQKDLEIEGQRTKLLHEQRSKSLLIILAILLCMLAAVIFVYFRSRARTTRRIADQEKVIHAQEKEKLLHEREVAELTASLETQEKERNRIARDLHDGLGSLMSGISAQIETLKAQSSANGAPSPHLGQLRDMVKEATAELRRTSYELMPASLLRQGLEPAIRDLCVNLLVKNGIEPSLEINSDLTVLTHEQQLTIYRIVQELLNNIVKHADAGEVFIQFNTYDNEFSLVVEDDGKGFDVAAKKQDGGLGLGSLQSRVNLLKGFLDIASVPGEGTTVTVNFSMN